LPPPGPLLKEGEEMLNPLSFGLRGSLGRGLVLRRENKIEYFNVSIDICSNQHFIFGKEKEIL